MSTPYIVPIPLGFVYAFLVIQDKQALLIDTGLSGSARRILRTAAIHGISPEMIKLIILTHGHPDHTGSAIDLQNTTHCMIALHPREIPLLASGSEASLKPTGTFGRLIAGAVKLYKPRRPTLTKPDVYLADKTDLSVYGIDAQVVHTPGHTPGSISVITVAGDAIIGDLLLIKPFGLRKPSYPFFIDDLTALKSSVRKILDHQPDHLYAAHGGHLSTTSVQDWSAAHA